MKKAILFLLFLFICIGDAHALDITEEIASELINNFKSKNYEQMYGYFFIPSYFDSEDIRIDKECALAVLKTFNQKFGELENYTEINISELKNRCLGAVCGIGEAGFYDGNFSIKDDSGLYLKTYKAHFSKIGELYIYIFLYNHRGKIMVTQFGIAFPSATDDATIIGPAGQVDQIFYKIPNKKIRFLAERFFRSHSVGYSLPTKEGEYVDIYFSYQDFNPEIPMRDVKISLPQDKIPQQGERVYNFITQQGEDLSIKFIFVDSLLQSVDLNPPPRNGDTQALFTVETKEGFMINFIFEWKSGKLVSSKMEPKIHPFSGVSYIEVPGQN